MGNGGNRAGGKVLITRIANERATQTREVYPNGGRPDQKRIPKGHPSGQGGQYDDEGRTGKIRRVDYVQADAERLARAQANVRAAQRLGGSPGAKRQVQDELDAARVAHEGMHETVLARIRLSHVTPEMQQAFTDILNNRAHYDAKSEHWRVKAAGASKSAKGKVAPWDAWAQKAYPQQGTPGDRIPLYQAARTWAAMDPRNAASVERARIAEEHAARGVPANALLDAGTEREIARWERGESGPPPRTPTPANEGLEAARDRLSADHAMYDYWAQRGPGHYLDQAAQGPDRAGLAAYRTQLNDDYHAAINAWDEHYQETAAAQQAALLRMSPAEIRAANREASLKGIQEYKAQQAKELSEAKRAARDSQRAASNRAEKVAAAKAEGQRQFEAQQQRTLDRVANGPIMRDLNAGKVVVAKGYDNRTYRFRTEPGAPPGHIRVVMETYREKNQPSTDWTVERFQRLLVGFSYQRSEERPSATPSAAKSTGRSKSGASRTRSAKKET